MNDPYALQRFVEAQRQAFQQACEELRAGAKRSHWIWFIFPQIKGLGRSETAKKFAVSSREEAEAYLRHPVLGPRLRECARLACLIEGRSAHEIFGAPDDLKFRSSMTLFAAVAPDDVFSQALVKYFDGKADPATVERL
jgi:uncharacterized protein (DUF1810 family)